MGRGRLTHPVGSTEALHQLVEDRHVLLGGNEFRHVGKRRDHIAHLVDESIGALDVGRLHLHAIDAGIAGGALRGVVVEEVVVTIGDTLVDELFLDKLHQGHGRIVGHAHHGLPRSLVASPIRIIRHLLCREHGHGVEGRAGGESPHTLTLPRGCSLHARQTVQLHRVVHHAAKQQQFFL